eukprot:TRINITY_DN3818_c0_g1_i1.p1 TRINITY_DN3818_c0_g1~~TRINITY_DN3818_c0_g1_i1.p1  ORF type:complete len:195 (+),score=-15.93 TRINITY_DN3818_c0_g1_i1:361-945(+)
MIILLIYQQQKYVIHTQTTFSKISQAFLYNIALATKQHIKILALFHSIKLNHHNTLLNIPKFKQTTIEILLEVNNSKIFKHTVKLITVKKTMEKNQLIISLEQIPRQETLKTFKPATGNRPITYPDILVSSTGCNHHYYYYKYKITVQKHKCIIYPILQVITIRTQNLCYLTKVFKSSCQGYFSIKLQCMNANF